MVKDPRLVKISAPKIPQELALWWINLAIEQNQEIGLAEQVIIETPSIIINAVGSDWLEKQLNIKVRVSFPEPNMHPIIRWLETPTPFEICSAVEFTRYLTRLNSKPGFSEILKMLQDNQSFESTFLQLATAFRLEEVGVSSLQFEPDAADGRKSDIYFEYERQKYLCECFVPESKRDKAGEELFRQASSLTFNEAKKIKKRVIVFTDFENVSIVNPLLMNSIKKKISSMIQSVQPNIPLTSECLGCNIEVYNTSWLNNNEEKALFVPLHQRSTAGLNDIIFFKNDLPLLRKGLPIRSDITSRYITKNPSSITTEKIFEKIAKKVAKKKTAQTKSSSGDAKGIMVLQTPLARPDNQYVNDQHRQMLRERVLGRYDHISALIFVDRIITPANKTMYVGYFMHRDDDKNMRRIAEAYLKTELNARHLLRL